MWQSSGRALSGNMPSMINCSSQLFNLKSITQNDSLDGQAAQAVLWLSSMASVALESS